MIRVSTSSRLHLGFLSLARGDGVRRFGGVGLMAAEPATRVVIAAADRWSADGPCADRALEFARRFADAFLSKAPVANAPGSPCRVRVEQAAPEHVGLGAGTQLALAVARGLAHVWGLPDCGSIELARRVGRGRRSALGIHGFQQGGFLVEAGKIDPAEIAPLIARLPVPAEWRILLVLPRQSQGLHGSLEADAIDQLETDEATTDALSRLVLLGMLPALVEADLDRFGAALYEFNRRVGEIFATKQAGVYHSPRSAEIVRYLRGEGVTGVAQSSWGPALAAITDADRAEALSARVRGRFDLDVGEVFVSRPANEGAAIEILSGSD